MANSRSTSRVFLLSSIVLGVVAMGVAFVYLENSAGQERGPKAIILVARHDLRAGTSLDPDKDLAELEIPARLTDLKGRALSADLKTSYKSQRVNRDVLAGTPVMMADLATAATLELKAENRAMSIQVKGANALGGLLIPGDLVKLLVTRPVVAARPVTLPTGDDGVAIPPPTRWETVLVAPTAFRVLGVDQRLSRSRSQLTAAEQYQTAGESTAQHSVMLEVTEAQAKSILEQTAGGQLQVTLLLCPPATQPSAGGTSGN